MLAEQRGDGLGSSGLIDVQEHQGLGVCRLAIAQDGLNPGLNRCGLSCPVIGIENRNYPSPCLQKGQQLLLFGPQHDHHLLDSSRKQRGNLAAEQSISLPGQEGRELTHAAGLPGRQQNRYRLAHCYASLRSWP